MLKISDAVRSIISKNTILKSGLQARLYNLSRLAELLRPAVEARTKKSVQTSAVTMNLSRLQRELAEQPIALIPETFEVRNIFLQSRLAILTFSKSRETSRALDKLFRELNKKRAYLTITEGTAELTIIIEEQHLELAQSLFAQTPHYREIDVASLSLKFSAEYVAMPGFVYTVAQQLFMQSINVLELSSTTTELIIYLKQTDAKLAFDTLYARFASADTDGMLFP